MKVTIFTSSPNKDGLTAACGNAAMQSALNHGGDVQMINLNHANIGKCSACGDGWGTCRAEHFCQVGDGFQQVHKDISDSDCFVIVTPVYWGEMSESAKAFFDRLRRCEALKRERSLMSGKRVVAIAAAGGSGNGTLTCLESMERLLKHINADIFDLIPITRKSRAYKLDAISASVTEMLSK